MREPYVFQRNSSFNKKLKTNKISRDPESNNFQAIRFFLDLHSFFSFQIFHWLSTEQNLRILVKFCVFLFLNYLSLWTKRKNFCKKKILKSSQKHSHSIDIQLFSIESVYLEWKQAKKAWSDLARDMIVQNCELLVQGFINQLVPHLASQPTANYIL